MDLQKLRYFTTLSEELHFGRAAGRLFLSQSALSTAIRSLERSLGVDLFHRTSRQVALTAAGEDLLPLAHQVLAEADNLLATVRMRGQADAGPQTLRLAFVGQAANELTPRLVEAFLSAHPGVLVERRQVSAAAATAVLQDGEADVAILRLPVSAAVGLSVHRLFAEQRVAVVPSDHWAAVRSQVALAELLDETWVLGDAQDPAQRRFAVAQDRRDGRPVRPGPTVATLEEYLEAIGTHQGIGLAPVSVSRFYARPGIAFVEVPDADPSVVALAWPTAAPRAATWGASLLRIAQDLLAADLPPGVLAPVVPGRTELTEPDRAVRRGR